MAFEIINLLTYLLTNEYCYLLCISTVGPKKTVSFKNLELVYMMTQKVILCL